MAEAVKFTFDEMFDTPGRTAQPSASALERAKTKPRWTDEEAEQMKADAHSAGFTDGLASAEAAAAQATADALTRLADATQQGLTALAASENTTRAEAATLSFSIARKLARRMLESRPQVEIEAVIAECLTHMHREPRLIIKVNADQSEAIGEAVKTMAHERGMDDRILLIADAGMAPGDCAIDWSDGGLSRDMSRLEAEAAEIIDRYVETLGGLPEANSPAASEAASTEELSNV